MFEFQRGQEWINSSLPTKYPKWHVICTSIRCRYGALRYLKKKVPTTPGTWKIRREVVRSAPLRSPWTTWCSWETACTRQQRRGGSGGVSTGEERLQDPFHLPYQRSPSVTFASPSESTRTPTTIRSSPTHPAPPKIKTYLTPNYKIYSLVNSCRACLQLKELLGLSRTKNQNLFPVHFMHNPEACITKIYTSDWFHQ